MGDFKMLAFRIALATNTSVEYWMKVPYSDMCIYVKELKRQSEEREKAIKRRRRR